MTADISARTGPFVKGFHHGLLGALTGLAATAATFAAVGDKIYIAAQRAGMSAEAFQELAYAAQQTGTDMDALSNGLKKMEKSIGNAANGSDEAKKAFREIGLSLSDLNGLRPEQQFQKIADGIAKINNPAQKTAATLAIFGKGGADLLPLLEQGSAGIEQMRQHAEALGIVMRGSDAAAAHTFADSLKDLKDQVEAVLVKVGSAVAEYFQPFASALSRVLKNVLDWIDANHAVVVTILKVSAGVAVAGAALAGLGLTISGVGIVLGGIATIVGVVGSGFTLLAAAAGTTLFTSFGLLGAAAVALGGYLLATSDAGKKMGVGIASALVSVLEFLDPMLGSWSGFTAGLSVIWIKGVGMLRQAWIGFKGFLNDQWESLKASFPDVVYGWGGALAEWAIRAIATVRETANAIKDVWNSVVNAIADKLAATMIKSNVQAEVLHKYDGKTLTKSDADMLAAPELQRKTNEINAAAAAKVDKEHPGLSAKDRGDAIDAIAQPQIGAAGKETRANYQKNYAGKKLDDGALQNLIDQQTADALANEKAMAKQRDDALEKPKVDQSNAIQNQAQAQINGVINWSKQGLNETPLDHERDAQKAKDSNAKEMDDEKQSENAALSSALAVLKGSPKLSADINAAIGKIQGYISTANKDNHYQPKAAEAAAGAFNDAAEKHTERGTFNASALQSLEGGGGTAAQQTAENTKRSHEKLALIEKALTKATPLTFTTT